MTAPMTAPPLAPTPARASRSASAWRAAWPWLAAAASGGLATLCFAPWNQEWLCWFALTPLLAAVWAGQEDSRFKNQASRADQNSGGQEARGGTRWQRLARWSRRPGARGFLLGYVAGLVFFYWAFCWLIPVTVAGWAILPFYMGLYFALWGGFMGTVARPWAGGPMPPRAGVAASRPVFAPPEPASSSPLLRSRWNLWFAFLGAACWTGLEWVRGWMFSGFGWNDLGVGFHANLPFLQLAEWTGVGGLSFLAAFVNVIAVATVLRFSLEMRSHRVRPHFDFTLTVAGTLLLFALGIRAVRWSARDAERPGAMIPLRVAAVQPAIPLQEIWDPAREGEVLQTLRDLSQTAEGTRPQLLLWPEAATPYGLFDSRGRTYPFIADVAREAKCNLVFGSLDYDFGPDGRSEHTYNAAMLVAADTDFARPIRFQIYRKIHLVPYGEYVPFRHSFPLFAWVVGDQVPSDLDKGAEPKVFELADPLVRAAPLVCFEDTLGRVARQPVLRGAQLFVNLTNDAWFARTAANQQQLAEAVFRTVENRRPMVRCANTGVTAFIDRIGRVTQLLRTPENGVFERGVLAGVVDVPTDPALTFYTRHGEIFSIACAAAAAVLPFMGLWRRLRRLELRRRGAKRAEAGELPAAP